MRAREASKASEVGEVSQPVQAKRAGAGEPVQPDLTVNIPNLSRSSEQNLVGHFTRYPSRSS